jgi:replicative DNA helicase
MSEFLTADEQVIGQCLGSDAIKDVLAKGLEPHHFRKPEHQAIFQIMKEIGTSDMKLDLSSFGVKALAEKRSDLVAEAVRCAEANPCDQNLFAYVTEMLQGNAYTMMSLELRELSDRMVKRPDFDKTDYISLVTALTNKYEGLGQFNYKSLSDRKLWAFGGEILDGLVDENKKESDKKISTGITKLDQAFGGGWKKGRMYALGARSSMGKTTLALNFANTAINAGKSVAFFTVEMGAEDVMHKLLSLRSGINYSKFEGQNLTAQEKAKLSETFIEATNKRLSINDKTRNDFDAFKGEARRLKREHGIDLIIFDYIQQLNSCSQVENRVREMTRITSDIQALAKDLDVAVICLAQLNRLAETEVPGMHHLKESGSIEQDSDGVILLHRDKDSMVMTVAKARHGERVSFEVGCNYATNWFGDLSAVKGVWRG